ncbi:hypothetical protein CAV_0593 [Campylobacter avium LMG 24591]|uniref:Uncharacterized protein n=1 Tax=Campylobacter avium LMG 24591 TaxID=522484 RepID=A0A222MX61_9BACT|nr:hypothetical protein [Campylobacter avium]ASQ30260.1 hypothetical protein CAV_0593 [Campylobacter avium LMG 24591]OYD79358.1 hypothetical protein CAV8706_0595 [Campylobacter avium]
MSDKLKEEIIKEELKELIDEMLINFISVLHIDSSYALTYLENALANFKAFIRLKGSDESEILKELNIASDEKADEIVRKLLREDKR